VANAVPRSRPGTPAGPGRGAARRPRPQSTRLRDKGGTETPVGACDGGNLAAVIRVGTILPNPGSLPQRSLKRPRHPAIKLSSPSPITLTRGKRWVQHLCGPPAPKPGLPARPLTACSKPQVIIQSVLGYQSLQPYELRNATQPQGGSRQAARGREPGGQPRQ